MLTVRVPSPDKRATGKVAHNTELVTVPSRDLCGDAASDNVPKTLRTTSPQVFDSTGSESLHFWIPKSGDY
jgi:hypothetical protein